MQKPLIATALLLLSLILTTACAQIRPVPAAFEPRDYRSITYEELLHPEKTGLKDHEKVKVDAYFWQYLNYDPAIVRNYLTRIRHPLAWRKLEFFALYGEQDMKGYYDLAALDEALRPRYPLSRLDRVTVYGELDSLGWGYYLHVHHLEKITDE